MSALFNFHSFLTVVLLGICTCTFLKMQFPAILEQRTGFRGFFWKAARIGGFSFLLGLLLSGISGIFVPIFSPLQIFFGHIIRPFHFLGLG
ncbi:hypothetical protein CRYUN_Cryun06bG0136300 [Craigia yunnanensis]